MAATATRITLTTARTVRLGDCGMIVLGGESRPCRRWLDRKPLAPRTTLSAPERTSGLSWNVMISYSRVRQILKPSKNCWCGVVWCGVVWCGCQRKAVARLRWCGVGWCGVGVNGKPRHGSGRRTYPYRAPIGIHAVASGELVAAAPVRSEQVNGVVELGQHEDRENEQLRGGRRTEERAGV